MEISVQLTSAPIARQMAPPESGAAGAWAEFRGIVRGEENGGPISGLEYEAYPGMAEREIRRLLGEICQEHPCLAAKVIHRVGVVPVGEAAVYIGVAARHRGPAFAALAKFMDRLKEDVPIWKRRALAAAAHDGEKVTPGDKSGAHQTPLPLDDAMAAINSRCRTLLPERIPLEEAFGRVLRETVCAAEDWPASDRSTRDGYAILASDPAEVFRVVEVIHAADWKPRQLQPGEAVRVATGAALPCDGLRVVMQEHVERRGDAIQIIRHESALNLRRRGEEAKAGEPVVTAGVGLDAGKLALLATAGCARPLVSRRVRVMHFTTGDEIIAPGLIPQPGQVRDSNSILIRSLLQLFSGEVTQAHLREDFETAKAEIAKLRIQVSNADVVLVSGGASMGDSDFTRRLLEWLGFEIVFGQVALRPGKPLIFGTSGERVAFGLPGNPLSHFVCFHFAVATALAKLTGAKIPKFLRGRLAAPLNDADCPRETLWPARWSLPGLEPLPWASSGDVTCFATANALVRVPANSAAMAAGAEMDFLPAGDLAAGRLECAPAMIRVPKQNALP